MENDVWAHFIYNFKSSCCICQVTFNPVYFAKIVADNVSAQKSQFGVLVCGSGIGMSIAANRFRRVRAALCRTIEETALSRAHNNANVLVLGSGIENDSQLVEGILKTFFTTQFEGGRHQRRVEKIDE